MATAVKQNLADTSHSKRKAEATRSVPSKRRKNGDEIWDELLATLESKEFLKKLAAKAQQDYLDGNVERGGFGGGVEE